MSQYPALFKRHKGNPILTAADWPYPAHSVFNPGAVLLPDGTTLLLCRVEDRTGLSHFCAARSVNGVDDWVVDREPTLKPDPENFPEELWGIEDPRITFIPEMKTHAIAYTAYSRSGPGVALAFTDDFKTFERYGMILSPDDKDATLLPHRIDGQWALIHRPAGNLGAHMWISYSSDLKQWGGHKLMMEARQGGWWDANKIGLSPPPLETAEGWLTLYHGVRHTSGGPLYRLGLALFDLKSPDICLKRTTAWVMGPEEPYERQGDMGNVVFPCGLILTADGDTIHLYYGAADTCIAMATCSLRELLEQLDRDGNVPPPLR